MDWSAVPVTRMSEAVLLAVYVTVVTPLAPVLTVVRLSAPRGRGVPSLPSCTCPPVPAIASSASATAAFGIGAPAASTTMTTKTDLRS